MDGWMGPLPINNREFSIYDEGQWEAQYEAYSRSRFGGKINPSLLDLKHLIYLDLSYNDFGVFKFPNSSVQWGA